MSAVLTPLTAHETAVLAGIDGRRFSFFDEGVEEGSGTWGAAFAEEIAGLLGVSARTAQGVLGSLVSKRLMETEREPGEDGRWTWLTEAGVAAIEDLRA